MKYIKLFENIREPQVDDYVICSDSGLKEVSEFTQTHIGRIVKIKFSNNYHLPYQIFL